MRSATSAGAWLRVRWALAMRMHQDRAPSCTGAQNVAPPAKRGPSMVCMRRKNLTDYPVFRFPIQAASWQSNPPRGPRLWRKQSERGGPIGPRRQSVSHPGYQYPRISLCTSALCDLFVRNRLYMDIAARGSCIRPPKQFVNHTYIRSGIIRRRWRRCATGQWRSSIGKWIDQLWERLHVRPADHVRPFEC